MGQSDKAGDSPVRIFVFDGTRLRSHLFFRFMSTHPDLTPIYHPFLGSAMFGHEHLAQHLQHSEMRERELKEDLAAFFGNETYESCKQDLAKAVAEVEQHGKIPLVNEHWFMVLKIEVVLGLIRGKIHEPAELGRNPSCIPDDLFDSLRPVLLIRHPALSINSIYRDVLKFNRVRPGDEDFSMMTSNKYIRLLFDYFTAQGRQPVVVDAEDMLWRTDDLAKNVCAGLGGAIDPKGLSDTWEPTPQDQIDRMNPKVYAVTKNIHDSKGIERAAEQPPEPDLNTTVRDWTEKYGSAIAEHLRELAEENMPHYEYLKQFKA